MCRNITELRGLEPAATDEEIEAAARQYVRKVSGITRPSGANVEAFETAVAEVTAITTRLLAGLPPRTPTAQDRAAAAAARSAGPSESRMTTTLTQPALKEWSAAVHALLDGRQTVLLRKGGIHEKRFAVTASRFLLFPTVAHSHAERVRPEHRDLLDAAAADSTDDALVLRAGAKVVAAVEVNRPEALDEIAPLHIWTAESVRADRLDFRPKHRLTVLVVQASPLVEPLRLARAPGLRGLHQLGAAAGRSGVGRTRCTTTPRWPEIAERVRAQSVEGSRGPAGSTSRDAPSPRCTVCVAGCSRRP